MNLLATAILALDDGTAAVLVAAITCIGGPVTLLYFQQRRSHKEIQAVNRAVNNVPPGTPTLIKRVENLERSYDQRTDWLVNVFQLLGDQLGVRFPDLPREDKAA